MTAWTSTPPLRFDGLPQTVTLWGWLLPGPVITVPFGAPRLTAICAAVRPLPYRFEASAGEPAVPFEQVVFGPTTQCVQCFVVGPGFTPGAAEDDVLDELCAAEPGEDEV